MIKVDLACRILNEFLPKINLQLKRTTNNSEYCESIFVIIENQKPIFILSQFTKTNQPDIIIFMNYLLLTRAPIREEKTIFASAASGDPTLSNRFLRVQIISVICAVY